MGRRAAMHQSRRWILLLPLLLLYLAVIVLGSKPGFIWDESGYVTYAGNLVNGFAPGKRIFSIALGTSYTPGDHIIWWGPGYPLLLVPFVIFQIPWLGAKLLNGFLLFGAVLYLYHLLKLYLPERQSLAGAWLFGLYPLFFRWIVMLYTEILVVFLLAAAAYHFCRASGEGGRARRHVAITGIFLGWLALTKVFFGYVILASLAAALLLRAIKRNPSWTRGAAACAIAYLLCTPWFAYTWYLTGKPFYWGNSGGISLYWMSTPYEDESGDWIGPEVFAQNAQVSRRHGPLFQEVSKLPAVRQDEALKRAAVHNITAHPGKFVRNVLANVGRMVLHYPYSYASQTFATFFQLIPNMFIVAAGVAAGLLHLRYRKRVPSEVTALLGFNLIAFGGSSLLSAYPRQFVVLVPLFAVWILVVIMGTVRLAPRVEVPAVAGEGAP